MSKVIISLQRLYWQPAGGRDSGGGQETLQDCD